MFNKFTRAQIQQLGIASTKTVAIVKAHVGLVTTTRSRYWSTHFACDSERKCCSTVGLLYVWGRDSERFGSEFGLHQDIMHARGRSQLQGIAMAKLQLYTYVLNESKHSQFITLRGSDDVGVGGQ